MQGPAVLRGGMLVHVFATCEATLAKAPFAAELASEWIDSQDDRRRRCGFLLLYELAKDKRKGALDDAFFLGCIERIQDSIHSEENWVKDAMNTALLGIGKRSPVLNKAAIRAVKAMGPIDVDYGECACEPVDLLKHLTSDYLKQKFGA